MHFIIIIIITEESLEMWDSCSVGGGEGVFFFSPPHFTYITSLMPTVISGRNYGNKFTASMGAYTMMDLVIP